MPTIQYPVVARALRKLAQTPFRPPGQGIPGQQDYQKLTYGGSQVIPSHPMGKFVTEDGRPVARRKPFRCIAPDEYHRAPPPAPDNRTANGRNAQLGRCLQAES